MVLLNYLLCFILRQGHKDAFQQEKKAFLLMLGRR